MRRTRITPSPPPWETMSTKEFQRLKFRALDSLWSFLELINFYGGTGKFGAVHRELAMFLQEGRERKLLLMPRGHLKSTMASTLYVMWRIYQNPNIRILVGTANKANLAEAFVREVKQYFENASLREHVWDNRPHIDGPMIPALDRGGAAKKQQTRNSRGQFEDDFDEGTTEAQDRKVVWRSDKIQVLRDHIFKEPTLTAASVGSPNTGEHYDLVIYDDLVTHDNSDKADKALKIINWTFDIESVLNPYSEETGLGEEVIVLGTRYFRWDYYSHLLGENLDDAEDIATFAETQQDDPLSVFTRNIYANGVNMEEGYLWPEGFNEKTERRLRRTLPARRFATQYLNTHLAGEDAILRWDAIVKLAPYAVERDGPIVRVRPYGPEGSVSLLYPILVIDPAASTNDSADFTAMGVGGTDEDGNMFILDLLWGHFTPSQLATKALDLMEKWDIEMVTVEGVAGFANLKYILSEALAARKMRGVVREYRPKGDKIARIENMLEPVITDGRFYLANGIWNAKEVKEEITYFPSPSVRDDIPDVIAVIRELHKPLRKLSDGSRRRTRANRNVNSKYGGTR